MALKDYSGAQLQTFVRPADADILPRQSAALPCLMPETILLRTIVAAAAAAGIAAFADAADNAPAAPSMYRLRTDNPGAFRLGSPAPAPPAQTAIAAALADKPYAELIDRAAREASLDPALVHALIHVESGYNPAARSPKGALGLMQVLPETAARYGVADTTRSVTANLSAGTRYLRDLMAMFDGRLELALAAYNAGENAVLRHGHRIPPYPETKHYVPAVLAKYREWQEPAPAPTGPRRIEYLPGTMLDATVPPRPRP